MNERIQELAEQALTQAITKNFTSSYFTGEKLDIQMPSEIWAKEFAELIAQDAISVVQSFRWKMDASNDNIVEGLKQHFGVE